MWKGGLGRDLSAWLTSNGWRVTGHDGTELAGSYGREDAAAAYVGFLTAVRAGDGAATS
jgi:hypothetical protein